ncbi:MAG: hypothetical protein M3220_06925 [Chloroflexota bacterium]|nr:hypothetical protein [Chloroflexota bacterium]
MYLGTIVRSNSHIDYVCRVDGVGEVVEGLAAADYGFGTFVRILLGSEPARWLVGLVYDTVLLNPDVGRLEPRLSAGSQLAAVSPDDLDGRATLIGIIAIGTVDEAGHVTQGVPVVAARIDARVERMMEEQVRAFHGWSLAARLTGKPLQLSYVPLLLAQASPLVLPLVRHVLEQLKALMKGQAQIRMLDLLLDELSWQGQVGVLGGSR